MYNNTGIDNSGHYVRPTSVPAVPRESASRAAAVQLGLRLRPLG